MVRLIPVAEERLRNSLRIRKNFHLALIDGHVSPHKPRAGLVNLYAPLRDQVLDQHTVSELFVKKALGEMHCELPFNHVELFV